MWKATRCSSTTRARRSGSSIRQTGEVREAEIFVAVLGASNYTYAEARARFGLQSKRFRYQAKSSSREPAMSVIVGNVLQNSMQGVGRAIFESD
jgi:hypothetical protein